MGDKNERKQQWVEADGNASSRKMKLVAHLKEKSIAGRMREENEQELEWIIADADSKR